MSQEGRQNEEGPVRVRLYGLVSMTRKRYLLQVAVFVLLAGVVLALWWLFWPARREELRKVPSLRSHRLIQALNLTPVVIFGLLAIQATEVYFVLRRFARKEAERKPGA
jgi:hypothetical protein